MGEWDANSKRMSAKDTKGVFVYFACFAVCSMMRMPFINRVAVGFAGVGCWKESWGFFLIIA